MKVLKVIKNIFLGILAVIFYSFTILITLLLLNYNDYGVTEIGDKSLIIVREEVSSPNYKKGDLVLVEKKRLEDIKPGNEIFAYRADNKGKVHIDFGVVGKIHEEEKAVSFENGSSYSIDYVTGVPTKSYKDVGTFLSIIESKWGFLGIILVPCFLIFVYQIYALVVEIKYGKDDDEQKKENNED